MNDEQIRKLIHHACVSNGVGEISGTITYKFNNRFTRRLADANAMTRTIRISTKLWGRATPQQKEAVVVHEACHIVTYFKAWSQKQYHIEPHGKEWKESMVRAGFEPQRCHDIDRTGLYRPRKMYIVSCDCYRQKVTKDVALKIIEDNKLDNRWECKKCFSRIRYLGRT